jgi:hypothetical protein
MLLSCCILELSNELVHFSRTITILLQKLCGLIFRVNFSPVRLEEVKVKVKFSLERAMKAQRGSRGIALLFL